MIAKYYHSGLTGFIVSYRTMVEDEVELTHFIRPTKLLFYSFPYDTSISNRGLACKVNSI